MSKNRQYDNDFKVQAVKLAKEIGTEKAAMEKEIKRLNEMNEFLEDAAAFFAASRQKSGKSKD
ncbi:MULTISPECIES: hypothetical protein [Ruminococcus]|uniref:hypothetical protein n=1 Tax=Ruminococcus TaxID=1263 RepID=UPI0020788034